MTAMAEKQTLEIGKGKAGPGRVGYLTAQAAANPAAFLTLIGKVLPTTVVGDPDNPLTTITRIELVAGGK